MSYFILFYKKNFDKLKKFRNLNFFVEKSARMCYNIFKASDFFSSDKMTFENIENNRERRRI